MRKTTLKMMRKTNVRDYISDLPLNIIETILMFLPIEEAVRTTVLSKSWKYKWVAMPELTFIHDKGISTGTFVRFIDRVLLLHKGPIYKFKLWSCHSYDRYSTILNQRIIHLAHKQVKEIIINVKSLGYHKRLKIPCYVYSCLELTHLELYNCTLEEPPLDFVGFRKLKSLKLHNVNIESVSGSFDRLLSACPVLQRLELVYMNVHSIRIFCPHLKHLCLQGDFGNIFFNTILSLDTISINLSITKDNESHVLQSRRCNLIELLRCPSRLRRLVLSNEVVKLLRAGYVAGELDYISFDVLKCLELYEVDFEEKNELLLVHCLLTNSPSLQELWISASKVRLIMEATSIDWEKNHKSDNSFEQLKIVHITQIWGSENQMEFIRLLLAKSPLLKTISIRTLIFTDKQNSDFLMSLLQLPRASSQAEIDVRIDLEYLLDIDIS